MTLPSSIETRLYAEQVPEWQRFQASSKDGSQQHPYQRQYAHVYHQRLAQIGPRIWKRLEDMCPTSDDIVHVKRILELPEDQMCACVGTLVVEREMKMTTTSALEEADEDALISLNMNKNNSSSYYLEDESGRVALKLSSYWNKDASEGEAPVEFCTGLVIGLIGVVGGVDGVLNVERVIPATAVQTVPPVVTTNAAAARHPHVLLLSGIECGSPHASSLPRDMLISYLQGLFPHEGSKASAIVHVIVAGGLVYHPTGKEDDVTRTTAYGCRDLDVFLYQVTRATGIPTSILPGQNDPTTANWPQRPLHSALIPVSSNLPTGLLSRCPNPYAATFAWDNERRTICGTDGLNVADWMQQTNRDHDALSALLATLRHGHMCPTGPSSVPTAPHTETDPMVLPSAPCVYFAGNCARVQTQLVQTSTNEQCRLVCIPKFIDTGMAVLVNLHSLNVEVLRFAM
jgi:DNA polymerase delta subunit 2